MYNNILWWEPITCHEHTQLGPRETETWRPVDPPVTTKDSLLQGPGSQHMGLLSKVPLGLMTLIVMSSSLPLFPEPTSLQLPSCFVATPLPPDSRGTFQVAGPSRLSWLLSSINLRNTRLSEDCRGNKALEDAESSEVTCKYLKLNKSMKS